MIVNEHDGFMIWTLPKPWWCPPCWHMSVQLLPRKKETWFSLFGFAISVSRLTHNIREMHKPPSSLFLSAPTYHIYLSFDDIHVRKWKTNTLSTRSITRQTLAMYCWNDISVSTSCFVAKVKEGEWLGNGDDGCWWYVYIRERRRGW